MLVLSWYINDVCDLLLWWDCWLKWVIRVKLYCALQVIAIILNFAVLKRILFLLWSNISAFNGNGKPFWNGFLSFWFLIVKIIHSICLLPWWITLPWYYWFINGYWITSFLYAVLCKVIIIDYTITLSFSNKTFCKGSSKNFGPSK